MTRSKSFETAAARRRKDPIVWTIDGVEVLLRASMDLAEIAPLTTDLTKDISEDEMTIEMATQKRRQMIKIVEKFVDPSNVEEFQTVSEDLDFAILNEMMTDLVSEYTGAPNPTPEQSSSVPSSPTGMISTDTAPATV
jgi:hypothetical protein